MKKRASRPLDSLLLVLHLSLSQPTSPAPYHELLNILSHPWPSQWSSARPFCLVRHDHPAEPSLSVAV
jgi:hypothetical protein